MPVSLIVALVCMMQTAAVVRSFPNDPETEEKVSRDFAAVGIGSILAALIGGFAVDSSPPRTAIVHVSGGQSQLAGLLSIAIVAAIALVAAGAFAVLPVSALSGVLVFIGMRIFRVSTMREIYRRGGYEILLVAASAALVVFLPIQTGVTMSILLSLVHGIYIVARPDCAVLSRVPGTTVWWEEPAGEAVENEPGVLVFAPGAPINFTNAAYVRGKLMDAISAMAEPCRLVVIEARGVIDIDFTGSQMLQQVIGELRQQHTEVARSSTARRPSPISVAIVWAEINAMPRPAITACLIVSFEPISMPIRGLMPCFARKLQDAAVARRVRQLKLCTELTLIPVCFAIMAAVQCVASPGDWHNDS